MGFIWDVVKELTKTVVNVHSLGAFDVPIFEDEEGTESSKAIPSHSERRPDQRPQGIDSEISRALEDAHLLTGHEIKKQEVGIALGIFMYWRLGYEQLSTEERKRSALFIREDCQGLHEVLVRRMIAEGFAPQTPLDRLDEYIKSLINDSENIMGAANRLSQLFAETYMLTTGDWPMEATLARRMPLLANLKLPDFCESVQRLISNTTEERLAEAILPIHVIRSSGGLTKYQTVLVNHFMARILNEDESSAEIENQQLPEKSALGSSDLVSPSLPRKHPSPTPAEWVSLDGPQPMLPRLGVGGTRTLPLKAMWRGRSMADLQNIGHWINEAPTSADAALNLAVERFRYREWSDASWWLKLAAEQGNTAAKAELAALHIRGLAMIADPARGQAMLAECNGIMPGLLLNDPTDFGNSFDGKVPMRVVIHKNVYDQNNMDTWEFFAAPEGETFMIEFNMNDEIELTGWSEPVWVEFGNGPLPGYECFSGFLRYTSPATAFLSPSLYAKRKEEFRARCARGA